MKYHIVSHTKNILKPVLRVKSVVNNYNCYNGNKYILFENDMDHFFDVFGGFLVILSNSNMDYFEIS